MNCDYCRNVLTEEMLDRLLVIDANQIMWLTGDRSLDFPMGTTLPDGQVRLNCCRACVSTMQDRLGVVTREIDRLRQLTHEELVRSIEASENDDPKYHPDVTAPSGTEYPLHIMIFWDNSHEKKNVRVVVSIAEGFMPPSMDFIMAPDGRFVGEC